MFDNIAIREFEEKSDLKKYVEFEKEIIGKDFWNKEYEDFYLRSFKLNKNEKLIIVTNSTCKTYKIIGVLLFEIKINNKKYKNINGTYDSILYIKRIDILEEMRNKKIGENLLYYLKQKYPDIKTFNLEVSKNNHRAINFYLKNGFEEIKSYDTTIIFKCDIEKRFKIAS